MKIHVCHENVMPCDGSRNYFSYCILEHGQFQPLLTPHPFLSLGGGRLKRGGREKKKNFRSLIPDSKVFVSWICQRHVTLRHWDSICI